MVDIFKVANGKIVEHWDLVQTVPLNPANNNTMFQLLSEYNIQGAINWNQLATNSPINHFKVG